MNIFDNPYLTEDYMCKLKREIIDDLYIKKLTGNKIEIGSRNKPLNKHIKEGILKMPRRFFIPNIVNPFKEKDKKNEY